tara:strand:+ start:3282 stop:3569 length:288 start_codon:yes stop_codon:yes gene_type:complete
MLTEKQALEKWCPFVRAVATHAVSAEQTQISGDAPVFNRYALEPQIYPKGTACIGSGCMAWRWFDQSQNYTENLATRERTQLPPVGYCGLAGASQ